MFNGLTAWFSQSTTTKYVGIWEKNGGNTAPKDSALYLFSEDASVEDTVRLYESKEYKENRLSIFHPAYIEDRVLCDNADTVDIAGYILPPQHVYAELKGKVIFKWETSSSSNMGSQGLRSGVSKKMQGTGARSSPPQDKQNTKPGQESSNRQENQHNVQSQEEAGKQQELPRRSPGKQRGTEARSTESPVGAGDAGGHILETTDAAAKNTQEKGTRKRKNPPHENQSAKANEWTLISELVPFRGRIRTFDQETGTVTQIH